MSDRYTPSPLLTTRAVARWLQMSVGALAQMRYRGDGPEYIKIGRSVRYERAVVDAWVEVRRRSAT